jgi:hypothetical protein
MPARTIAAGTQANDCSVELVHKQLFTSSPSMSVPSFIDSQQVVLARLARTSTMGTQTCSELCLPNWHAQLVHGTGLPRVSHSYPYPYLQKPIPTITGTGNWWVRVWVGTGLAGCHTGTAEHRSSAGTVLHYEHNVFHSYIHACILLITTHNICLFSLTTLTQV